MNQRFPLDFHTLQKLLEAAWVLQCERDRELTESRNEVTVLAVPAAKDELNTSLAVVSPVAPIYQRTEVAGALALAPDQHYSPLHDRVPFTAADVLEKTAPEKSGAGLALINRRVSLRLVWSGDKYRVALRLVPFKDDKDNEHALSLRTAAVLKRASRVTTAYAGPLVVLAIMLAFVFSLLGIHGPSLTAVKAADQAPGIADAVSPLRAVGLTQSSATAASEDSRADLSVFELPLFKPPALKPPVLEPTGPEPSHLRVTDPAATSLVEGLSRYEVQTVLRQAQYGDGIAALTLGMAYEIGRNVPQSCQQAAHWIAVAAEEGNSAAQYNLALRYVSGDGTPTDLDEARKWLEKAAGHGYQKARLTLQAPHL